MRIMRKIFLALKLLDALQSNLYKTATQKSQKKILMTNGSLMKVESIAECSPSEILLTCIKR